MSSHKKKVVVIGASGHGRVIADIIECKGDEVLGFLDDRSAEAFPDVKVLGKVSDAAKFYLDAEFVIGIGSNDIRQRIVKELKSIKYYTAIHPTAVVAKDVVIEEGTVVMANAVINTGSRIGHHSIINTAATVDHDNIIGNFVHISPGAHTAGGVSLADGVWLGVGAVVTNNKSIGANTVVGAGAVVVQDIPDECTVVGCPAKPIRYTK